MRTSRLATLGIILAVSCLAPSLHADDYYVDASSGVDNPGGGDQAQPWQTINYALDRITGTQQNPHRVLVAKGQYEETVVCDAYESIYGNYDHDGATWTRDPEDPTPYGETTISASDAGSVVVLGEGCTVDGFTLTNGSRDYGGGVYCWEVNATVSNCRIAENEATAADGGSAVYIRAGGVDSAVEIASNIIEHNTHAAIFIDSGTVTLSDNTISDTSDGRGICAVNESSLTLTSNTIQRNAIDGIYIEGGSASFMNNVISDTIDGDGLDAAGETTLVLSGDRILHNAGRGMVVRGGTLTASSCIVGDSGSIGVSIGANATLEDCLVCGSNGPWAGFVSTKGAGVFVWGQTATIRRSVICGNYYLYAWDTAPGGISSNGNEVCSIYDSVIVANDSQVGVGCRFNSTTANLKNNFFVGGGRVILLGTNVASVNNSVLYNKNGYETPSTATAMTMVNDLLWGNGDDLNVPAITEQTITHCNIEDGDLNGLNGNISVNPDFLGEVGSGTIAELAYNTDNCRTTITDSIGGYASDSLARTFLWVSDTAFYVESNTEDTITVYGDASQVATPGNSYTVVDYRLRPASLCVDAGTETDNLVPDHDFEGDPRPWPEPDGLVDIGADEYAPLPLLTNLEVSPDPANSMAVLTITFDATEPLLDDPTVIICGNPAGKESQDGLHYSYTYQVSGTEPEGTCPVLASGADLSGTPGSVQGTVVFDFTAPDAPVITTGGGEDFLQGITRTVNLEGTCAAGTDAIRMNGSTGGVTFASGNTTWLYTATGSEGPNLYVVTAVDVASNESNPSSITVTIDTIPPAPPVITTNGGEDFATEITPVSVEGTCGPDVAEIRLNGEAIAYTPGETAWQVEVELLPLANDLSFTAVDAAGNESGPVVISITLEGVVLGDLNGDGLVNAIDVQHTINQALGFPKPEGIAKADINIDGLINAIDVQLIINAALGIDISGSL
jgi:hypothetical protein